MRRGLVFLLICLSNASVAWAALGDAAETIEDSYGTLMSRRLRNDGTVEVVYQKGRYLYQVTFDRGVSVAEEYSRVDRAPLSQREIARFLKLNARMPLTSTPGQGGASLKVMIKKERPPKG